MAEGDPNPQPAPRQIRLMSPQGKCKMMGIIANPDPDSPVELLDGDQRPVARQPGGLDSYSFDNLPYGQYYVRHGSSTSGLVIVSESTDTTGTFNV